MKMKSLKLVSALMVLSPAALFAHETSVVHSHTGGLALVAGISLAIFFAAIRRRANR
jgi:hypothetical protein